MRYDNYGNPWHIWADGKVWTIHNKKPPTLEKPKPQQGHRLTWHSYNLEQFNKRKSIGGQNDEFDN